MEGVVPNNEQEAVMSAAIWKIDEVHSGIHFMVKHLVVSTVRGQFRRFGAELALDEADLTKSSVVVTIETGSVDTGNPQRDADLRSPNFFDAETSPTATFRSRRIERAAHDGYRVSGDLTIRGVTREVTLDAQFGGFVVDPWGGRRVGFTAQTSIRRSDFGIVWNQVLDKGAVVVSDRVDIAIDVEAVAQAQARAVA
jgi:polyisoprenoid-binding protein YceI